MGIALSTMQGIRSRAEDAMCPKSGRCVTSKYCSLVCPTMRTPPCKPGSSVSSEWLVFPAQALMNKYVRTRACAELGGSASSSSATGSSRWLKVHGPMRAVMRVHFSRWFGSRSTPPNCKPGWWVKVSTGLSRVCVDSAELVHVLSRRHPVGVHWARAAGRWDGAGLERSCDVSIVKQHLHCFRET